MANVTSYLSQNIGYSSVSELLTAKIPGLKSKNDKEFIGIAGFTAYAEVGIQRVLSSNAPDVTLEDGSVIADTIFLNPIEITISGEVAEINIPEDQNQNIIEQASSAIGVVSSFLPNRTLSQLNKVEDLVDDAVNAVRAIDNVINAADRFVEVFGNKSGDKSNQELFIDTIDKIHFSKSLTRLETAFRVYDNIRITNFTTSQNNESNAISFTITAKQLRLSELAFIENTVPQNKNPSKDLGGQTEGESDKGITNGDPVQSSLASSILGIFQ